MLNHTFNSMDEKMFTTLFKSMVRPHLEYCSAVWSPYKLRDIRQIERVQRRATKMVKGLEHLSYPERLKKLGLPTLEYRRSRADMLQVYKIMTGLEDIDCSKLFNIQPSRTRGHALKIRMGHARTLSRKKSFTEWVITTWNNLPESVVMAPTINTFKSRLNEVWKNWDAKFVPS